jgi:tetratricopeptide (TPR) repeat protein
MALERLLAAQERFTDLAELLESRMGDAQARGDVDKHRAMASALAEVLAERLGDTERAQRILQELLDQDPSYVPAILALAAVHESRQDLGAMRITLQRAVNLQPRGAVGAQLHLRLARLADSEIDTKREHLQIAFRLDPSNAAVGSELVALCRRAEQWADLAQVLERMEEHEHDPDKRRALALERVDLLLAKVGDSDAALAALAPIYQHVQDDPEINRRIADALFNAGRFDEAEGMYNWLVEVGRRGKRAKTLGHYLTRLAKIDLQRDAKASAREHLQEAYRIDTTNVETLMALATLYEAESDWREALKIHRTMLLQNADQSTLLRRGDIYVGLARAHLNLQEKPKAKAMLRRGLEEDPSHPSLGKELAALED